MTNFWPSCGYTLLERDGAGRFVVTDDYLRMYFRRPELALLPESCVAEQALHRSLIDMPRRTVPEAELAAVADADARENYAVMLRFRDRLLSHPTLEASYAAFFREDVAVPPAFIHHSVQVILRGLLEGTSDGLLARAAELFFREQSVSIQHGVVMAADAQTVQLQADTGGLGSIGRMLKQAQAPLASVELDVLDEHSQESYWQRDERYDTVLALNPGRPGAVALARVIERWIAHFHGVACTVTPIREIPDEEWRWHVGLDAEATAMMNDIYNGIDVESERMKRIVGLFRADFADRDALRPELAGAPVFLGLAMRPDGRLRMKPQNLLVNLPLARPA